MNEPKSLDSLFKATAVSLSPSIFIERETRGDGTAVSCSNPLLLRSSIVITSGVSNSSGGPDDAEN